MSNYISKKIRKIVKERAFHYCEYCMSFSFFVPGHFVVEHIIPLIKGGLNELHNLCFSCQGCNSHKFTKTEAPDPYDGQIVPLFHPRKMEWKEHFMWNKDFTQVIGITPVGRASTEALKLNRKKLQNFRRVMFNSNEHPPIHSIQ